MGSDIGRNDPCHCGSNKKYKKCHLDKDLQKNSKERQKEAEAALKAAAKAEAEGGDKKEKPSNKKGYEKQSWKSKISQRFGFSRNPSSQRKSPPSNKGG